MSSEGHKETVSALSGPRSRISICTCLYVWDPLSAYAVGDSEDSHVPNLLMIPGASVDHQISATPAIPFNAIN